MTRDGVEALFFRLAAIYPSRFQPQPGSIEEWTITAGVREVSEDVADDALDRWKDRHDWPPTIAEFLDECEAVVAERAAVRRAAQPAGQLESAPEPRTPAAAFLAAARELLRQRAEPHDHSNGRAACAACAGAAEREQVAHDRFAATLAELNLPASAASENVECVECGGDGLVVDFESPEGYLFFRPCRRCRPEQHELWAGGHLAPDHDCPECAQRRVGVRKRKLTDEPRPAPRFTSGVEAAQPRERDEQITAGF